MMADIIDTGEKAAEALRQMRREKAIAETVDYEELRMWAEWSLKGNPHTDWSLPRAVRALLDERDSLREKAAEWDSLRVDKERLKTALRAAPMPVRESRLKGDEWEDTYEGWWHSFASELAIDAARKAEPKETP